MDFSVIRPKKPKKAEPKPPPPPEVEKPPPPPPQYHGGAPPYGPLTPYMDELQSMDRLKSVEYSNSKFWKLNFDEYPSNQFGSSEYHHHPILRGRNHNNNYGYNDFNHNHHRRHAPPRVGLPPPHDHHYGGRLGLPAPEHHHAPPLEHHYGAMVNYGHPGAPSHYGGGFFSDENPNGCMIM